ncbi:MAG TPA: hypothetical protein VFS10_01795 [Pyrinomonadaceae bacterium]|nr:hypothetical protein [Pyrinomonadaceae bacterium]
MLFTLAALLFTGAALGASAQSRAKGRSAAAEQSGPKKTTQRPDEQAAPKKTTQRPEEERQSGTTAAPTSAKEDPNAARYTYEFEQPDFFVYFIHIEHDDAGRGLIRFERRSDAEQTTEPFQLSPAALERVAARWAALKFLDSTANYQHERTYPSYGKTRLLMKQGGRQRTAEFNYASDPDAFALADEYRRAADQAVLVFELKVAVESQPLETPKLLSRIDTLVDGTRLSDPQQLVPLLRELSTDERIPLVGRNQIARTLKKLEKAGK